MAKQFNAAKLIPASLEKVWEAVSSPNNVLYAFFGYRRIVKGKINAGEIRLVPVERSDRPSWEVRTSNIAASGEYEYSYYSGQNEAVFVSGDAAVAELSIKNQQVNQSITWELEFYGSTQVFIHCRLEPTTEGTMLRVSTTFQYRSYFDKFMWGLGQLFKRKDYAAKYLGYAQNQSSGLKKAYQGDRELAPGEKITSKLTPGDGAKKVTLTESTEEVVVQIHPWSLGIFLHIFGGLFGIVALVVIIAAGPSLFSFSVGLLVAMVYLILYRRQSVVTFKVSPQQIIIEKPLFPGLKRTVRIGTASVKQLYVVQKGEKSWRARGNSGRMTLYSDALFVLRQNGWRTELIKEDMVPRDSLNIIEKVIEKFVQIPAQPVHSTWYQKVFFGELTLDEMSSEPNSLASLKAKSLWMPGSMFLGLLVLLCIAINVVWWGAKENWGVRSTDDVANHAGNQGQSRSNRATVRTLQTVKPTASMDLISTGKFIFPEEGNPNALPVWGFSDGIRIGLAPATSHHGLIGIYAPYLQTQTPRTVNEISIEPMVTGQSGRDQSAFQVSRERPGKRGLTFWSSNSLQFPSDRKNAASGLIDENRGKLRVFIHSEPFANGAMPIIECVFDRKNKYEVQFITHAAPSSKKMEICVLSAIKCSYCLLNQIRLPDGKTLAATRLWQDESPAKGSYLPWKDWDFSRAKDQDGEIFVQLSTSFADPLKSLYADEIPEEWRYDGKRAIHYWRTDPSSKLKTFVNGRRAFRGSNSNIPGGDAFEYFEVAATFESGRRVIFGIVRAPK